MITPTISTEEKKETPPTEAKPDGAKPEGDKSLLTKPEAKGAPEKYEDFKLPEGYSLDEKVAGEATTLFKKAGLTQEQAQEFVDFYSAKAAEAAAQPYEMYRQMREEWVAEVKADPEIGNKLPHVKETVSRALDSLGDAKLTQSFKEAMDLTGAGDHPAFIKAFYKLALAVNEGKHVSGSGPSALGQRAPGQGPISAAKALYPNNP